MNIYFSADNFTPDLSLYHASNSSLQQLLSRPGPPRPRSCRGGRGQLGWRTPGPGPGSCPDQSQRGIYDAGTNESPPGLCMRRGTCPLLPWPPPGRPPAPACPRPTSSCPVWSPGGRWRQTCTAARGGTEGTGPRKLSLKISRRYEKYIHLIAGHLSHLYQSAVQTWHFLTRPEIWHILIELLIFHAPHLIQLDFNHIIYSTWHLSLDDN